MPSRFRRAVVASATLALAFVASSQAQVPAAATAPPPLDCEKPPASPPLDPTLAGRFKKQVDAYKDCIDGYAKVNGAKARELATQARAYSDAANNAIDEYNAYVVPLNEKAKADPVKH